MSEIETIRVHSASGWATINKADFDPSKHKVWTDGKEAETVETKAVEAEVSGFSIDADIGKSMADAEERASEMLAEPTDDELRDAIEMLTGNRPHHRTGRAKLVEMLKEAQGHGS